MMEYISLPLETIALHKYGHVVLSGASRWRSCELGTHLARSIRRRYRTVSVSVESS